ncbi:MAG TPA: M13 family metallopeptidase [Acidimicrobiia bacterium]|nr:M13 family metallopeptidase [Acidimicrobiia bacterium]
MNFLDPIDATNFDPEIDPGIDFYRYVNGGWLAANPVPAEHPAWGAAFEVHVRNEATLHELLEDSAADPGRKGTPRQKVGDYFAAGMDTSTIEAAGISPLDAHLQRIATIGSIEDLGAVLIDLRRSGVAAFHSLGIEPDFEDSDRYLVYLSQGGLGLPDRDYYLREDDRSKALVAAYSDHMTAQLENLGVGGRDEADSILVIETRLAEASMPAEEHRDLSKVLNRYDVVSLDELMPRLGLTGHLRGLGVTSETVSVDNATFFQTLDRVLSETPIEDMRSYLRWHLVRRFAPALPAIFEDEAFDFYNRKLGGQREPRERWTRVLAAATGDIGELVSNLYVDAAFSPEAKKRCEEMVDRLIEAMRSSIESLDWMTDATRRAALDKVGTFTHKIGYPDQWRDYSALAIDRTSFAGNRMRAAAFEYDRKMGRLADPVDKTEWEMPAHVVNAYYNPLHNEVVFPAGILQPPFFYADADDAVNFGGIGTVIGHEITHGFDDNGSRFDEVGRRRNWWTDEDRAEFENRAQVLVEQYSDYEVFDDLKVNGKLTLGENIADLGGLAIAYDAFVSTLDGMEQDIGGLSPVQRFFVSFATIWRMNYSEEYLRMITNVDVHSPNPFRANGSISNFPQFAEAFGVSESSPMRRAADRLVDIW